MDFKKMVTADQRLAILQLLAEDAGFSHNGRILQHGLSALGHTVSTDRMRNHFNWLEEQELVTVDRDGVADLWIVKLTHRGEDAALGRARIEGVARPRPQ